MKYKILFTILILVVYLLKIYFDNIYLLKNREVYLKDLNVTVIDIQKFLEFSLDDFQPTSYKYWDIKKNKILVKREENIFIDNNISKNKDFEKIKSTIKTVCYRKKCWEFVGVVKTDNNLTVSLLSKDKKRELKVLSKGDKLLKNLILVDIKRNNIKFLDETIDKNIVLKIFEINVSKYYPKMKNGKL